MYQTRGYAPLRQVAGQATSIPGARCRWHAWAHLLTLPDGPWCDVRSQSRWPASLLFNKGGMLPRNAVLVDEGADSCKGCEPTTSDRLCDRIRVANSSSPWRSWCANCNALPARGCDKRRLARAKLKRHSGRTHPLRAPSSWLTPPRSLACTALCPEGHGPKRAPTLKWASRSRNTEICLP